MFSRIVIFSLSFCLTVAYNLNSPSGATTQVTCGNGQSQEYIRIGEKYYFLGETSVNWYEAAHICRRLGGNLALIETAEEWQNISDYLTLNRSNDFFWISGDDFVNVFDYVSLTNGLSLNFTAWSSGEPNNPGIEHCIHLWNKEGGFTMNNWVCTNLAHYICQREDYTRCWDGY
ncbi:C-type lectin 37Db-like [Drosophila nasuta]|uniref:C-type lectin 37Db-like n=1 Tax=Drosophila nasuta TaxID=42062 RepID=UPI00295EEDBB|nr:C-type lectin 37Db-like [Drosophila nasuta]